MGEVIAEMAAGTGQGIGSETARGLERRLVLRLLNYWRSKAELGGQPNLARIVSDQIPDIWPNCFIIALKGPDHDSSFIEFGVNLVTACGGDYRGRPLKSIPEETIVGKTVSFLPELLTKMVPISRGGGIVRMDGATTLYRGILLPLSEADGEIDHILGAANCRDVAQS